MEVAEIVAAVEALQQSGKIINFGLSNFTQSQINLIATEVPVVANQIEISLTQHKAMFDGTLDCMQQRRIQAMSWSPLGSVFKEESVQTKRIKEVLNLFTVKYGVREDVILLSFLLRHPANISPVIGTTNKTRILNANKALQVHLELQDWFALLAASQGHEVA
jgi:predicted oxidoreductase